MKPTLLACIASALLLGACVPPTLVVPNPAIPHQLTKGCKAEIAVDAPNGKIERQKVWVPEGYWIASPSIVEGAE